MRITLLLTAAFSLFFSAGSLAQNTHPPHCGTDEILEWQLQQHPELAQAYAQADAAILQQVEQMAAQKTASVLQTVPVVVHVIYDNADDNITKAQVEDAIRVLNEDFRRQNADTSDTRTIFEPVAADTEIRFELAKLDPQGNCTDGINRVQSAMTQEATDNVKSLISWPRARYLNIWVVRSIGISAGSGGIVLGYAYRPYPGQTDQLDGIVIRHDRMGTIGTSNSEGRTLTHEVGHYLGLKHTFDDGCFSGDDITDTPPVANASFGCSFSKNSCSNDFPDQPDMIENYMDYADDNCMNIFTTGQKNYMKAVINPSGLRSYLVSSANLAATGITVNPPVVCTPAADFITPKDLICEGQSVTFTDNSEEGEPSTWSWTFPGGTPATSTLPNPVVTYNTAGTYDVTLTVSNSAGSSTKTIQNRVTVRPENTLFVNWLQENFETYVIPNGNWHVQSGIDSVTFRRRDGVGFGGSQGSVMINNYYATEDHFDYLISQAIDVSNSTSLSLTFKYAYARKNSNSTDYMRVYVSTDCGNSWSPRLILGGSILSSAPDQTGPFVPTDDSQWKTATMNLNQYALSTDNLLIRWEFKSGRGNNVYIDDINLAVTLSGEESLPSAREVNLYPNPATHTASLEFVLTEPEVLNTVVTDLQGRQVIEIPERSYSAGPHRLELGVAHLPAGLYIVRMTGSQGAVTRKLSVR